MLHKVSRLLLEKFAGVSLLCAGLFALALLLAGPSSAVAATAAGKVTTNHWKNGSSTGYTLTVSVTVPESLAGLATATLTGGPQAAVPVQLNPDSAGTTHSTVLTLASRPTVGNNYTVQVSYQDNPTTPSDTLILAVTDVLDVFATPTAPLRAVASSANPSFTWTAPAPLPSGVGGFAGYSLSLNGADIQWNSLLFATSKVSTLYTPSSADLAAGMPTVVTPGVSYDWSIFTLDNLGNSTENRGSSFMIGTNFTGKVTDLGGKGIQGVRIYVYSGTTPQDNSGTTLTLSDGSYMFGGLTSGSYKVRYSKVLDAGGLAQVNVYYNNKLQLDKADLLPITSGVVTAGINAVIGGWGSIAGKVVNSLAVPIVGVKVQLYDSNGVLTSVPSVTTKADGSFDVSLVPPGTYKLGFSAASLGYADLVYGSLLTVSADNTIDLPTNPVLNKVNISGKVSNGSGAGVPGIWIWLLTATTGDFIPNFTGVQTGPDGNYAIGGIAAGNYKVLFDTYGTSYSKQYYNNKATVALAELVAVSTSTPATNINAVLLPPYVPTITSFAVPALSSSLTVSGISIVASGVAGYLLTESAAVPAAGAAGWSAISPTSYTFASAGVKTLYAWAKGSTGLVSASVLRNVTITIKPSDCDANGNVDLVDVQSAINMFLGLKTVATCIDSDNSTKVSISEVQKTINLFLGL